MEQFLNEYVTELYSNVSGAISVSLVSTLDGSILAYKAREGVDNRLASSYQLEIFRNAILSFENTEGLNNKTVDDVSIVYQGQTHLIGLLQSKKILDHIILDDTANVGMAKLLIRKIRTEAEKKSF
ncbi:MAG: hypothetical protein D8H93_28150 [Capnocytophaga sp.]|jgi:hypothetical protein|uniref:hypothetical protein n=1 Tax=Capnocytophaga sp. oral taxon 863 TaxID=1227265 RepID=UPI00039760FA|nr:hypothetical protein [Capnocytophaga sp. oral taxon 863]ERI63372.1 hypothetical protein HMPREF1551_01260 [Capnocytophaga sp. oral taxon 863 str. F0517]RKW06774.1 MAG: hypothetical protein D8H93_28150 [Capnocytophaga sp.]